MPNSLASAFTQEQTYANLINEYADGQSQRDIQVTNSRRHWKLTKRLKPTQMATLRSFYLTHLHAAFYFYDHQESDPIGNFDETGVDTNGRFAVRFASPWEQSMGPGLGDVALELEELTEAVGDGQWLFNFANNSGILTTAGF